MKKLLLAVATVIVSVTVSAQDKVNQSGTEFSISGNVGSSTTTNYKLSAGGNVQAAVPVAKDLKLAGSVGYQNFAYKYNNITSHSSFAPILLSAILSLSSNFLIQAQLGYAISTIKGHDGGFAYSPLVGLVVTRLITLYVQYMGISRNGDALAAILAGIRLNFK